MVDTDEQCWERELFSWGKALGSRPCDVKIEETAYGGRCLSCTSPKAVGDIIISVPSQILITAKRVAEQHVQINAVIQNVPEELTSGAVSLTLMLFLISEKNAGADSLYQEYLTSIPKEYTTPFYVTDSDVNALLEGSPLQYIYSMVKEELESNWKVLCETIKKFSELTPPTWEEFIWAYHVVESRSFTTMIDGEETNVLVPIVDMADHHPTEGKRVTKQYNPETECFEVRATAPFSVGDQLYLQYGQIQNWQLVLYYGFALLDNVYDTYEVCLDLPSDDTPADAMRRSLLLTVGENTGKLAIQNNLSLASDGSLSVAPTLLPTLRLLTADAELLGKMTVKNLESCVMDASMSTERETRICDSLIAMFKATLDSYPTSLEEDVAQLNGPTNLQLTPFENACIVYRIGQKKILIATLAWVGELKDAQCS
eukprot:CFRG4287T1